MAPGSSTSPVTLEALASLNSLESNTVYIGNITKVRRNKTVLYVDMIGHDGAPGRVAVEARGDWAQQLDQKLVKGEQVIFKGVGGRIAKATQGQKGARVIYEREISGFYEDGSSFHFSKGSTSVPQPTKKKDKTKATVSTPKEPLQVLPQSAQSTSEAKPKMKDKEVQTPPGRFIPDPPSGNEDEPQLQPQTQHQTKSKKRSIGTAEMEDLPRGEEAEVVVPKPSNKRRKQEAEQEEEIETENENEDQEETTDWRLKVSPNLAYTSLIDVKEGKVKGGNKHFAVVIVGVKLSEPRSPGGAWYIRLQVTDPSLSTSDQDEEEDMPTVDLQWYEKNAKKVPKFAPKDILLLRKLYVPTGKYKISRNQGSQDPFIALKPSELLDPTVLPSLALIPWNCSNNVTASETEIYHAVKLAKYYKDRSFPPSEADWSLLRSSSPPQPGTSTQAQPQAFASNKKLCEIKDMEEAKFCDIFAQIVKCYVPDKGGATRLFVTDYTSNSLLMNYTSDCGSVQRKVFPPGQQVLQVSLFEHQHEPLLAMAQDQRVGHYVEIKNLRPKINELGLMECTLVDDQKYADKRYVRLVKGQFGKPILDIIKRKKQQNLDS